MQFFSNLGGKALLPLITAYDSFQGRLAAKARNAYRQQVQDAVIGMWKAQRKAYGGNRTDFAKYIMQLLRNGKLKVGETPVPNDFELSERTISARWLKGI